MWGSSHLNLECFIERFYSSAKLKLMFFDMFTKCKLAKSLVDLKRKAWIYNCLYVFPLRSAVLIVFVISNVKHTTRTVRNTVLTFWEVITLNLLGETLFDIAIDSSYFVMENSKKNLALSWRCWIQHVPFTWRKYHAYRWLQTKEERHLEKTKQNKTDTNTSDCDSIFWDDLISFCNHDE